MWINSKTQTVIKLENSNCDKTQIVTKPKKKIFWLNSKKSNLEVTKTLKLWLNSKTEIVTKLKNSNCDQSQKLKLWQDSKTQIFTKLKNWNFDKTQKLKLWQYQNCKKLNSSNLWQNFFSFNFFGTIFLSILFCYKIFVTFSIKKNKLTHWQPRDVFRAAFCDTRNVFNAATLK